MLDEDLLEELAEPLQSDEEKPEEHLQALEECLSRLGESERELIEQRYFSKSSLNVSFSEP